MVRDVLSGRIANRVWWCRLTLENRNADGGDSVHPLVLENRRGVIQHGWLAGDLLQDDHADSGDQALPVFPTCQCACVAIYKIFAQMGTSECSGCVEKGCVEYLNFNNTFNNSK